MNYRRRRNLKILFTALVVYALILVLLVLAESRAPESSIHGFGEALWYSIVTLTTVGYGDLAPVTPLGRLLGIILVLCSLGVLTTLLGMSVNFLSGEAVPRRRLRSARARRWYAFNAENEDSILLASELLNTDPDAFVLFPQTVEKLLRGSHVIRMDASAQELTELRGTTEGLTFFCMETDARKNMADAAQAAECGCRCCCMTDYGAESLPDTVQVFSRKEVLARNYWKEHPLTAEERTVVLIGCGSTGSELLEHGLLTNVFLRGRTVSYHVFGEHSGFCALHHTIVRDLAEDKPDEDRLTFYDDAWQRHPELLAAADRIILCTDDDQENLRTYDDLHRWYPTEAKVHIRFPETLTGVTCFGRSQDIFTPEFVLRNAANRLAILMNDLYNEGSPNPTAWESLSDFLRRSNIAAADHMIVKVRCLLQDDSLTELNADLCRKAYEAWQAADPALMEQCQEMEHRRWCRFHRMYNWEYAPVRNNALRQHPLLMPYTELSEENQRKNSYAFEMLGRVAERQVRL